MHGAATILYDMLGNRHTDQSCHHEVWVHLINVNARLVDRLSRDDRSRRLNLKKGKTAKKEGGLAKKEAIRSWYRSSM